jgi:hypothetical protein
MSKLSNILNKAKLIVDEYEECPKLAKIICFCYTNEAEHEEYIVKEVSMAELFNHVTGDKNKVWVTTTPEDVEPVSFNEWYSEVSKQDLFKILGEVINKREKRGDGLPDIGSAIAKVANAHYAASHLAHLLNVLS